ncbi:uncharacterized protein LOC116003881 [Ipomoea triloba]|uniref:uncharacterized protein LOC116003881 n=1 Tax=Ipomoea triloba TaxID=35885 RepID=UPI00125E9042|nr:uncharacterized protein LOC116003881 [Ipomoea triloba]
MPSSTSTTASASATATTPLPPSPSPSATSFCLHRCRRHRRCRGCSKIGLAEGFHVFVLKEEWVMLGLYSIWHLPSMSSDDSQNNSARDYDNQYDDEEISESGGLSPGHSDDVQVVDARPVGGGSAKARPTAPIQSTSSKAPPKKIGKVPKGGGTSSRPKEKSTSKPNTTGGNNVELDADDTPTEMTVREEEQVGNLLEKGVNYKVDRSLVNIVYCHSRRWIGVNFDSLKACLRFPLDPFLIGFVNYYNIVPRRIAPNGHRILACFPQICERHQVPCTIDLFNFLHVVKAMGKSYSSCFIMIQCCGPVGKIVDLPNNNRGWRGKYLRVLLGGDPAFKNKWYTRLRKCTPPFQTPEIHAAVDKISSEFYSWGHYYSPKAFAAARLPPPIYGSSDQIVAGGGSVGRLVEILQLVFL